jgi:hypothetical protein
VPSAGADCPLCRAGASPVGGRFCPRCGEALSATASDEPRPAAPADRLPSERRRRGIGSAWGAVIGVAALVAVVATVVGTVDRDGSVPAGSGSSGSDHVASAGAEPDRSPPADDAGEAAGDGEAGDAAGDGEAGDAAGDDEVGDGEASDDEVGDGEAGDAAGDDEVGDGEAPGTGERGTAGADAGSTRFPPCTTVNGAPCGRTVLAGDGHLAAVRVSFGVIVVDAEHRVRRLQVSERGSSIRWTVGLPSLAVHGRAPSWPAAPAAPAHAAASSHPDPQLEDDPGGRVRADGGGPAVTITRVGTLALVGTPDGVHAVDTNDGRRRWSVRVDRLDADTGAWRAWQVGPHVLATAGETLVALDVEDGRSRWSRSVAGGRVDRLPSGAAVLYPDRVELIGPWAPGPRWTQPVDAPARWAWATEHPSPGPVVLTGARTTVLDPRGGTELADLGARATATRAASGQVVALSWDDDTTSASVLRGLGSDGRERWRRDGPEVACCGAQLRPLADGRVLVVVPGGAGDETGWVLDPLRGGVVHRVVRPADAGLVPVAVTGGTAVWLDGEAYVGADAASGTPRWRAESQSELLLDRPVLLATRAGVLRP